MAFDQGERLQNTSAPQQENFSIVTKLVNRLAIEVHFQCVLYTLFLVGEFFNQGIDIILAIKCIALIDNEIEHFIGFFYRNRMGEWR